MSSSIGAKKLVWIDTAPAYGDVDGDCDNGHTIVALMIAEIIVVRGISPVYGLPPQIKNSQTRIIKGGDKYEGARDA